MKKILFVITGLNQGGAEAMLYKLLANIDRARFDCVVVSLLDKGVYGEKIESLGMPVFCLNLRKIKMIFKDLFNYVRMVRRYKPNIIQGWMYHGNLFAFLTKLLSPKSVIVFNIRHSIENSKDKLLTRLVIKINAWFSHRVKAVINNSEASQRQHNKIGFSEKNKVYIANGFDVALFKPTQEVYDLFRIKQEWVKETKIIGNISRFHPMKNHLGILRIFKKIKEETRLPVKFVLAGEEIDSKNKWLVNKINEMRLEKDCILLGPVKTYELMPALDVYLSCSLWGEGFPNVLGEAMACEVPCVATDVGDCKQIIAEFGDILPVKKYEKFAADYCIKRLSESGLIKKQRRQYIVDNYPIQKIVQQYENLFNEASVCAVL